MSSPHISTAGLPCHSTATLEISTMRKWPLAVQMRNSEDLLGRPSWSGSATCWMRWVERIWSTRCTNSPDCRPIRHSALSTSSKATAAAFAYWMAPSWVISTAPGSACSRSSWSDMWWACRNDRCIVAPATARSHTFFAKCHACAKPMRCRVAGSNLPLTRWWRQSLESAWALAARAAAARSLSFLLGRLPLMPPVPGGCLLTATAVGSKPATVSRASRWFCRFSIN